MNFTKESIVGPEDISERTRNDLAMIEESAGEVWQYAREGYQENGRGAVVPVFAYPLGFQLRYLTRPDEPAPTDEFDIALTKEVATYDPENEFVLAYITDEAVSIMVVHKLPSGDRVGAAEVPDIEAPLSIEVPAPRGGH